VEVPCQVDDVGPHPLAPTQPAGAELALPHEPLPAKEFELADKLIARLPIAGHDIARNNRLVFAVEID
jgi:hypothetical protein